jgi:hypothetical protein
MDYISMSLEGTVISTPTRNGKDFFFSLRNERGKYHSDFKVIVKDDERPIDVNKGDKVAICNAGFFVNADGEMCLAVIGNSLVAVERIRCNRGEKEV